MLTTLGELEILNIISLRVFRRKLSPSRAKASRALLQQDILNGELLVALLTSGAFARAMQVARRRTPQFGSRTLDILHVASALELKAEIFFTLDSNQARLAEAEGLTVAP